MGNTFREVYKKTGNSSYQLVGNVGVNGIKLDIMKGASSSAAGEIGLVPKPLSGQEDYLLTGNGSWQNINKYLGSSSISNIGDGTVKGAINSLNKHNNQFFIQAGYCITSEELNNYVRHSYITFSTPYAAGTIPAVSITVENYKNSNLSTRVHGAFQNVTYKGFDLYILDPLGELNGAAWTACWITIGIIV